MVDKEPWFDGLLVAQILKYENPSRALKIHIREKHRQKVGLMTKTTEMVVFNLRSDSWLISEPGLYSLIMNSKMELANDFQDWVFEEVLPSIRKTGEYKLQEHPVQKKLTFKIENEFDIQCKVVNFIKNQYPNSLFVSTLRENQITPQMRIKSNQLGYLKGSPDLLITNCHKSYQGFAIEFKTPKVLALYLSTKQKCYKNIKRIIGRYC